MLQRDSNPDRTRGPWLLAKFSVGLLAVVVGALGCRRANDPDTVADRFVDAYYIEFDLERAKTYAAGSALARLEREGQLVDAAREKTAIQEAKARVYYEAPERRTLGDDMVRAVYVLDIRRGTSSSLRPTTVMVARRDGVWKVIQFREEGAPAPPPSGDPAEGVGTSTRAEGR